MDDRRDERLQYARELSFRLTRAYEAVMQMETRMLSRGNDLGLTVSEVHVIQAVGVATLHTDATMSVSEIADRLGIRVPSATSLVNHLVEKGMLEKRTSKEDARRREVSMTHEGEVVYRLLSKYNRELVDFVVEGMTDDQRVTLLEGVTRIEEYYERSVGGQ